MLRNFLIILFLFISFDGIRSAPSGSYIRNKYENSLIAKIVSFRLPANTAPRRYTLNVEPHMEDEIFSFEGTGSILFEVLHPTSVIVFHASEFIEIDELYTKLKYANGSEEIPIDQKWDPLREFYTVRLASVLAIGNYSVELSWTGYPVTVDGNSAWEGFFRADDRRKYIDNTYVAVTHLQATSARSVFPCWDEPALKAEFDIAIRHHPNYTALSNMPVKEITDVEEQKVWTLFQRTPPMSTYLATFAVAPYSKLSNDNGNVTFWVLEEDIEHAKVAFEMTHLIPAAMERYTGIHHGLPKLDGIVVPMYGSTAIENWGLITYISSVFYEPGYHGVDSLNHAVTLASHEIVHQWFGNLVTPAWWDDLWLSEAFATYFSFKMLDNVLLNWNAKELFTVTSMNDLAFHIDSRYPRRPIKFPVETTKDISRLFNHVTYDVGAVVIRMLESILTEKIFQNGIKKYFQKHQFGSVTTDDLWQSLQEAHQERHPASDLNIKELMDPWIKQIGFPLVNVTRDYRTGTVIITQSNADGQEPKNRWTIPISYATKTNPFFESTEPTLWLKSSDDNLTIHGINKDDWIIVNVQQIGYYQVNYDWENWARLSALLNSDKFHEIHVINRAQIIYDLINYIRSDQRYIDLTFDTITYLHRETNYLPWSRLCRAMDSMVASFQNSPSFDMFKRFMLYLMNGIVNHIGLDDKLDDDHLTRIARSELLPRACLFGHQGCLDRAPIKMMEVFSGKTKKLFDPHAKEWIYCTGLRNANESIWALIMDAHSANPLEQKAYRYLGCTDNQVLIVKYLDFALAENSTYLYDEITDGIMSLILSPGKNFNLALSYWIGNFQEIMKYYQNRQNADQANKISLLFARLIATESQFETFSAFVQQQGRGGKIESDKGNEMIREARQSLISKEEVSQMFISMIEKRPHLVHLLHE